MDDIDVFFAHCDALTSGKSAEQVLIEAHALLSDGTHWTQYARARREDGTPVRIEDPAAVRWDIEGAVSIVCNNLGIVPPYFLRLLDRACASLFSDRPEVMQMSAGWINDMYNHGVVLRILETALEMERS